MDSLDQFVSSGKVQSASPSIFGKGGPAKKHQLHKLSAADVWPDGMPDPHGSSTQAQFYADDELDAEPQQQYQMPPQPQAAGMSRGSSRGTGRSPLDGGASFGAVHGRRAAGGTSAGSLGMQAQGQQYQQQPQQQYHQQGGAAAQQYQQRGGAAAQQYQQRGGAAASGFGAGRRTVLSNGGSTRPW